MTKHFEVFSGTDRGICSDDKEIALVFAAIHRGISVISIMERKQQRNSMARNSDFQRERKKKQLRQNMVTNDKVRSAPVSWAEDHKKTVNVAAIVIVVTVVIAAIIWLVAAKLWRYKTYEVNWRADVSNASSAGYVSYGDGIVVMNKDGATYYDSKSTKVWSAPYDMSNPKAAVKGDYILIYDLKGKNFTICNKSGITGSGTTSQVITKGVIASTGVTVIQTEDNDASLISYYRNTGEEIAVSIRNPLQTDGYPLDISVSPNGQQLAVSYYSIADGTGTSSISFYDFEQGKEAADRIVASFDYSENGAYVPRVVYLSDTKAFAVGDCCISFFDVSQRTSITRNDITIGGEIQRMFYNSDYLGLVVSDGDGYQIRVYTIDGKEKAVIEQDTLHTGYAFQQNNVVMYDSSYCEVLSFSGRIRFSREFGNNLYTVIPGAKFKTYYLATMEELQKIKLK